MIKRYSSVAALLVVAMLTACGGGSGSSGLPHTQPSSPSGTQGIVETFSITVPAASGTSARARRPLYVSPNTGSVQIGVTAVNGQGSTLPATVAKIAAGAPNCSSVSGSLLCTVAVAATNGSDTFVVSTYQSSTGTGAVLASTTLTQTVSGSNKTPVALSLGGVPATVAFSPAFLPLVNDGAIHRYPITLEALDASGATIVGADSYQSSIALQIQNDPTHALSLSSTSVTQPGTVITVTYNSSKSLVDGSIAASGTGVATATLNAAPLNVAPMPIFLYDDQSTGLAVTLSQPGFTGTFSAALANASDGNVNLVPGTLQSGSAVATVVPSVTFDVTNLNVDNGSYTATVPVSIVPQPGTYASFGSAHTLGDPLAMVEGPDGNLWVADPQNGAIDAFNPSNGTYTSYPVDPSDDGPISIAFDPSGNIWFGDGPQIGEFVPSSSAVTMYQTGLQANANVTTVIAGASGTMWFYDAGLNQEPNVLGQPSYIGSISTANGQIVEYPTNNDASPQLGQMSMVVGPDGAVWFGDGYNYAIGRLNPSSGAIAEYPVSTPSYPLQQPMRLVDGPDGNVWFASVSTTSQLSTIGTVNPSSKAVSLYTSGLAAGGVFYSFIQGSDHNLWFAEQPYGGIGFSTFMTIGVVNPTTHAIYQYPSLVPQFGVIVGLVDRGDRTLWMLDNAYGQIGKVAFK